MRISVENIEKYGCKCPESNAEILHIRGKAVMTHLRGFSGTSTLKTWYEFITSFKSSPWCHSNSINSPVYKKHVKKHRHKEKTIKSEDAPWCRKCFKSFHKTKLHGFPTHLVKKNSSFLDNRQSFVSFNNFNSSRISILATVFLRI